MKSRFKDAVFLDVGGSTGQTLEEVVKPRYKFRTIYSFEPMPTEFDILVRDYNSNQRVVLCDYGLNDVTAEMDMYGDNSFLGASNIPNHFSEDQSIVTRCSFIEASSFFRRHLTFNDVVVMKLNCEGGEVAILNNLIDSGEIWKLTNVMIDFDIRRAFDGLEYLEIATLQRLSEIGFTRYSLCEQVMTGDTHQERIANWLDSVVNMVASTP